MNSSVIIFPGSNCDRDIAQPYKNYNLKTKWYGIKKLIYLIVIPGGFSYGDYLRSGAVAAKLKF